MLGDAENAITSTALAPSTKSAFAATQSAQLTDVGRSLFVGQGIFSSVRMYKPDGTLLSVYPIEDGKAKAIF
jgi:hypothetical protein